MKSGVPFAESSIVISIMDGARMIIPSCTSTTEVYDVSDDGSFQSVERGQQDGADGADGDPFPEEERGDHGELDQRRGAGDEAAFLTKIGRRTGLVAQ